jgi:outer membrane protein OmpA-like peptidoglycan-associated protein
MMARIGMIGLAALVALSGCATPSLVLLPGEHGDQGAVAVLESGGRAQETVVAQGNSRTRLGGPNPRTESFAASGLSAREALLIGALPPSPLRLTLYFTEGTTRLVETSQPDLDRLKQEVAARPGVDVQVTGYTDTLGSEEDNDLLSQRRAEEILAALAEQGIDRRLMTAVGRGERNLVEPTADGVRNGANRRVEVIVR